MISANFNKLIDKLVAKTESNQAIWYKTNEDGEYKLVLKTGAVTTKLWARDCIGDINIFNEIGILMDSNTITKSEEDFIKIKKLHSIIQYAFNKVDETFNHIFEELDNDNQIGEILLNAYEKMELPDLSMSLPLSKVKIKKAREQNVGNDNDLPF